MQEKERIIKAARECYSGEDLEKYGSSLRLLNSAVPDVQYCPIVSWLAGREIADWPEVPAFAERSRRRNGFWKIAPHPLPM